MNVNVAIADGPLHSAEPWIIGGAGAILQFEGVVRPAEGDQPLEALIYEDYPPMTERELYRLAMDVKGRFGLLAIAVEHSRGEVPAGRYSFRLRIASIHRKEGLAAMDEFIDRMKRDIPLWKVP